LHGTVQAGLDEMDGWLSGQAWVLVGEREREREREWNYQSTNITAPQQMMPTC